MTDARPDVALRPSTGDDRDFFARVYAGTREQELAAVAFSPAEKEGFLAQQFAAQTAHYDRHYASATRDVVLVDGEPAGRLMVWRSEGELRIVDLALLPAFRARGVGTALLSEILSEADERAAKASIQVERMNPARRLYERLGFVAMTDDGVYLTMERPPAAQAKLAS